MVFINSSDKKQKLLKRINLICLVTGISFLLISTFTYYFGNFIVTYQLKEVFIFIYKRSLSLL